MRIALRFIVTVALAAQHGLGLAALIAHSKHGKDLASVTLAIVS